MLLIVFWTLKDGSVEFSNKIAPYRHRLRRWIPNTSFISSSAVGYNIYWLFSARLPRSYKYLKSISLVGTESSESNRLP